MGFWGTAISSNDMFLDVYNDFFQYYNNGLEVNEITQKLIQDYREELNFEEYCTNFWFALAKSQWECKKLEKETFLKVQSIIDNNIDLKIWENFDASKSDLKKRELVLDKFLSSLKIQKEKAKARKKTIIRQPKLEKGDCFIFELKSGNYGGAIVLEEIRDSESGFNLIAFTRINKIDKPAIDDFTNCEILVKNFGRWESRKEITWYFPAHFKKVKGLIEIVGNITISKIFDHQDYTLDFSFTGFSEKMFEIIDKQFDFEKNNPKPLNIKLNDLLK